MRNLKLTLSAVQLVLSVVLLVMAINLNESSKELLETVKANATFTAEYASSMATQAAISDLYKYAPTPTEAISMRPTPVIGNVIKPFMDKIYDSCRLSSPACKWEDFRWLDSGDVQYLASGPCTRFDPLPEGQIFVITTADSTIIGGGESIVFYDQVCSVRFVNAK